VHPIIGAAKFARASKKMLMSYRWFLLCIGLPVFGASSTPGIENFYQVDQQVYRGAQPETIENVPPTAIEAIAIDSKTATAR
jgi:hypothetical protein